MAEYSFQDRISRSPDNVRQRAINRGLVTNTSYSSSQKIIRGVSINNIDAKLYQGINASGQNLPIKISGSPNAMFSITITDSSGCSILKKEIKNVTIGNSGVYTLVQEFPSIKSVKGSIGKITNEVYTITINPSADTTFVNYNIAGVSDNILPYTFTLIQQADVKLTFGKDTSDSSISALTFTSTDVSKTDAAFYKTTKLQNYSDLTLSIAVKYTSYSAGNIYVKNTDYNNNIIKSNFTKAINYRDGETGAVGKYYFVTSSTRTETTAENGTLTKTDIPVDSSASWTITKEKFVVFSLDEDDNIIDFDNCKSKFTNKFRLNNTNDIVPGMEVTGQNVNTFVSHISSCGRDVILQKKLVIKPHTILTFKQENTVKVVESDFEKDKPGKTTVIFNNAVDIPEQTEVTFDNDSSIVTGKISQVGSGNTGNGDVNDVDLTCTISVKKFGKNSTTYNLDMSKIISVKPNAYNQSVVTAKNTTIAIDMIKFDTDTNRTSKTGTVVRPPSHGTVSAYSTTDDVFAYLPNNNFVGSDSFTFTMSDGTNTSDEKTILIEVLEGASGTSDTLSGGGG
jgi:hypothetical protein